MMRIGKREGDSRQMQVDESREGVEGREEDGTP